MHKLVRQKILARIKKDNPKIKLEELEARVAGYETARNQGKVFIDFIAEMTSKLKEETYLDVNGLIRDANPNVATAIIYNEGYKKAMQDLHSWLNTD